MGSSVVLFLVLLAMGLSGAQRCCYPAQFEIGRGAHIAMGKLIGFGHNIATESLIAMDTPNLRSAAFIAGRSDGKPFKYQLIQDFNKSVEYRIDETKHCQKFHLERKMQHCVPDAAEPAGEVYLGDKELTIETFVHDVKSYSVTGRTTLGVTKGTCIPNDEVFEGKLGFFTSTLSVAVFVNYTSGIANPDKFFTVPDYCPDTYSTQPKMYNLYDPMMFLK